MLSSEWRAGCHNLGVIMLIWFLRNINKITYADSVKTFLIACAIKVIFIILKQWMHRCLKMFFKIISFVQDLKSQSLVAWCHMQKIIARVVFFRNFCFENFIIMALLILERYYLVGSKLKSDLRMKQQLKAEKHADVPTIRNVWNRNN